MHAMLNIAVRAARAAGNVIVRNLERVDTVTITEKGRNDFVSEVDREAERVIIEVIRRAYPNHAIVAEESGEHAGDDHRWIIDPLDGTTNYLHSYPQFAVSIALVHRERLEQAVVFDPLRQELFSATRGEGAQLDSRRIRVSKRAGLGGALLGTGFPFRSGHDLEVHLATTRAFMLRCGGVRRAGAAALDLAYVAAGRLDGFWEFGLQPWDIAAGALLVREAGGMVADAEGGDAYLASGDVLAGSPRVLREMLTTVKGLRCGPIPNQTEDGGPT